MNKISSLISVSAVFIAVSCCGTTPPPRETVILSNCGDGGVGDADEEFALDQSSEALSLSSPCARACSRLAVLGCPESRKPPAGRTCIEVCKSVQTISSYSPACVAEAKDVEAVRKCPAVRCLK